MKPPMWILMRLPLVLASLSIGAMFGIALDSIPLGLPFGLPFVVCFLPEFLMTGNESDEKPAPIKPCSGDFDLE